MKGIEIGILFRQINRTIREMLDEKLKDSGISDSQMEYFMVIDENKGINQKQLAEKLHVGKTSATKAVKKLLDNDLIYRVQNEEDQRNYKLYLTESGERTLSEFKEVFLDTRNGLFTEFSTDELELLESMLNRLLAKAISYKNEH